MDKVRRAKRYNIMLTAEERRKLALIAALANTTQAGVVRQFIAREYERVLPQLKALKV